jgi:hypothetical protein
MNSIAGLLAFLMLSVVTGPVLAQDTTSTSKSKAKLKVQNQDYTFMDKPPDMPGISFPGKPATFVSGFFIEKTGARGARFKVPESADAVLSYYHGALNGGGWVCAKPEPGKTAIVAENQHQRTSCQVSVYPSKYRPGCDVQFLYSVVK